MQQAAIFRIRCPMAARDGHGRRRFRAGALSVIAAYRLASVDHASACSSTPALRLLQLTDEPEIDPLLQAEAQLVRQQQRTLAWAACLHPRLGSGSPAGLLPLDVVQLVAQIGPDSELQAAAETEAAQAAAFGMLQGLGA